LTNIAMYIRRRYISLLFRRLTEKYKLRWSVIEICSSIITEERVLILCSGLTKKKEGGGDAAVLDS
jgi:hypothetical protein